VTARGDRLSCGGRAAIGCPAAAARRSAVLAAVRGTAVPL